MKELMATRVEIPSSALWNANLDESAPKKDADWKPFEDAAKNLVEAAKSMMAPPLAKDEGKWKEESQKLVALAEACLKAVNEKNLAALKDSSNKLIEDGCTTCHKAYYTGP
jgi:cytochrome c556